MRRCLLAVAFALVASASFAREANLTVVRSEPSGCMSDWTPFRISLAGPVALPWGDWNVKGLDVGLWNDASDNFLPITSSKTTDRYFKFNLNLKDLRTGEIIWTDEQEIRKDQKKRILGM